MPDVSTNADSIRWYHSGAASNAAAQADPDASLGNYRSSTELSPLGTTLSGAIPNVFIDLASGDNGTGDGILHAPSTDTLTWCAPGGSAGAPVSIASGQTKLLQDGDDPSKFIRATRTSAAPLAGTTTVSLFDRFNNAAGLDSVASAEAAAGDDEYRCLFIRNGSASSVTSLKAFIGTLGSQQVSGAGQLGASGSGTITTAGSFADWPDSGFAHIKTSGGATREIVYYSSRTATALNVPAAGRARLGTSVAAGAATDTVDAVPGIRIAAEAPASQPSGNVQTIANESTAPTGVTWSTATTVASGINIGTLAAGNIYAIWIHRQYPTGTTATPSARTSVRLSFSIAADAFTHAARGLHRIANNDLERYELYRGVGAAPDFTAAPYAIFSALPYTTAALPVGTDNRFVLRRRNRYNLLSQNTAETRIRLDGSGALIATPPTPPRAVSVTPAAGGTISIDASYDYAGDGEDQADKFLVYLRSDGTNPDPSTDTPTVVTMKKLDGVAKLRRTSAAFSAGTTVKVIVRTRRSGTPNVDSTNAVVHTATAATAGPAAPPGGIF